MRISGSKTDEVTGEWRKPYNEELNEVYSSPNIVWVIILRIDGWGMYPYGGRGVYRVLVGNPEGKKPLGRPRHRWEDNIRMDFQEVGCGVMDWIELAQDRERWQALVNVVRNLRVPQNAGSFMTSFK
jgi:hypothetical protein